MRKLERRVETTKHQAHLFASKKTNSTVNASFNAVCLDGIKPSETLNLVEYTGTLIPV